MFVLCFNKKLNFRLLFCKFLRFFRKFRDQSLVFAKHFNTKMSRSRLITIEKTSLCIVMSTFASSMFQHKTMRRLNWGTDYTNEGA
jgi:hypothetical protein